MLNTPNPWYWCHCGTLVVPFMPSSFWKLTERKWCHDAIWCIPQFAFFGTGHCYGATLVAIRLPSLDGWQWFPSLWRCSNLKQKSCGLEKFESFRLQPPFLSLRWKKTCFLLWGSRFSRPKAHHFKYPPSEAVWTISLKVRSLAKFWLKVKIITSPRAPNLWPNRT